MNALEVGKKLIELWNAGRTLEALNTFYADDVESIEAVDPPESERVQKGIEAVRAKNIWWYEHHEVHSFKAEGPYPHGEDRFAVRFIGDVTYKATQHRMSFDEIGVYTLSSGKVVREEFFYQM
ncbi:MAG: nuclear transport factor 2 family protein [Myxococcota bacterium]